MVAKSPAERAEFLDALIQRSAEAVNRGDLTQARALAAEVLAEDAGNVDAASLLDAERQTTGEVRRISVMFCDLVGSTALSGRLDPELYRSVLTRYRKLATEIIEDRHGGHLASVKGDGLLALFGYPLVHPNDTERAVQSGLDIAAAVQELSSAVAEAIGSELAVRAAVHRGLLYIDPEQDDVYGHAANVAARYQELAAHGTVVVSQEVQRLVGHRFETEPGEPTLVKGVDEPVVPYTVVGRRATTEAELASTPLVGRGPELARLREAWEEARAGGSAVVLGLALVGEAGIGKTRVATTFATEVAIAGGTVIHLAGSADHRDVGLHPLRGLIEGRTGIVRSTPATERVRRLEAELLSLGFVADDALPLLAPVLALDPDAGYQEVPLDARKLGDQIAKMGAEYVLACLGDGPAVVVAEDHHAFDDATKELIDRLLRSGRDRTVLVVTSRGAPPHRTELLELGPLSPDACLALVDALAPPDARASDRSRLVERSDGVPLFLEELVRSSGVDAVAPVHRPARAAASTVPDVLYEPIMARLHATPQGTEVAAAASVIGRTVDRGVLAAALDLPPGAVEQAVDALTSSSILEPTDQPGVVRFRHELIREVAYDLLPPARRRELHAAVADLLSAEASSTTEWALIATHLERAGRALEAASALGEASEVARRRGDLPEAKRHLDRAVDLVLDAPPGFERDHLEVRLRLLRGAHAVNIDAMAGLATAMDYERCMELCLKGSFTGEMISTITCMWSFYVFRADLAKARTCSEVLRDMVVGEWSFWVPQNIASFAMIDFFAGDFPAAATGLEDAVAKLEQVADRDARAVQEWYVLANPTVAMYIHLAASRFTQGDLAGSDAAAAVALDECARLEWPHGPVSECYVHWLSMWLLLEQQRWDEARATVEAMHRVASDNELDAWLMMAMALGGAVSGAQAVQEGYQPGIADVQAITMLISGWEMTEMYALLTYYQTVLGATHAAMGDTAAARIQYEKALELAARTGMRMNDAETLRHLAHLHDDAGSLIAGLTEALELARSQGARHLELRIALDLHDIRGEAVREDLRRAVAAFGEAGSYPVLDEARRRVQLHG